MPLLRNRRGLPLFCVPAPHIRKVPTGVGTTTRFEVDLHGALIIAERISRPEIPTQCLQLASQAARALLPKPSTALVVTEVYDGEGVMPVPAKPVSWADIVFEKDGVPMADSRKVAEVFEKEHLHVLRDIRRIEERWPERAASNFGSSTYVDPTGRTLPCYHMTRDGFSFLALGWKTERAEGFKWKFLDAFNDMENELRSQQVKKLTGHITDLSLERDRAERERLGIASRFAGIQAKIRLTEERLERMKGELAVLKAAPKPTIQDMLRKLASDLDATGGVGLMTTDEWGARNGFVLSTAQKQTISRAASEISTTRGLRSSWRAITYPSGEVHNVMTWTEEALVEAAKTAGLRVR